MYKLYGAPGRGSAAPEAVLEQLEVAYEYIHLEPMDARKDAAYRKLNPQGQIPTLVDDDTVIWESAAICAYLCDKHPEAGLAPAAGSPQRGLFFQWLFFLSNTLQPAYMQFFYPDRYLSVETAREQFSLDAQLRIVALWKQLEAAVSGGPYLLGAKFSACDIYLYMLTTWHRNDILSLSDLPGITRLIEHTGRQPGVEKMMLRNAGH